MTMRSRSGIKLPALMCLVLAIAFAPHAARAALGEPESTATDDAQQLRGDIKATLHATYRLHEIQLPSGTVLREYATPGGNVFAVAWSGPTIPNLKQALGGYFDAYMSAAKAQRTGRRHLQIQQSDFVMESGGHMRAFEGRAYLPQALPVGTVLDEIR